jgi:hypothetical protein
LRPGFAPTVTPAMAPKPRRESQVASDQKYYSVPCGTAVRPRILPIQKTYSGCWNATLQVHPTVCIFARLPTCPHSGLSSLLNATFGALTCPHSVGIPWCLHDAGDDAYRLVTRCVAAWSRLSFVLLTLLLRPRLAFW